MHYAHRAWIFIRNKRKINFLLFCFLVASATFLLTGAIIAGYSVDTSVHLKELMGASFSITGNINESTISKESMDYETYPVQEQDVNFIKQMPEILESNYQAKYVIRADIDFIATSSNYDNSGLAVINTNSQLNSLFQNGYIRLMDGIHIDEKNNMEIMISNQLAEENQLNIGDSVEIYLDDNIVVVNVVGIFEGIQDVNELLQENTIVENMLFINENTMSELIGSGNILYEKVTFFLRNPSEFSNVKSEVLDRIEMKKYIVKDDTDTYGGFIQQLNRYEKIIFLLLGICVVASGLILCLLLIFRVNNRKHEIGIFLSMGNTKKEISMQFLCEVLIVYFPAFIVAMLLSNKISSNLYSVIFSGVEGLAKPEINNFIYLGLFIGLIALIGISVVIATLKILRYDPKKILADMG